MSAVAAPSAKRIAWLRRRRAAAAAWSDFRHDRAGMIGLVVLILFVAMALAAPLIVPKSELRAINAIDNPVWASPGEFAPMGTDFAGRSVWAQFVWGARISLLVGLAATVMAMLIGTVVGVAAGFYGGRVGGVLMRITEWFLVIPFLPLAIALAAVLGPSLTNIIFVIGITSWPSTARLVRAQVLTLKERLYVDRSRALGASDAHLMGRHDFTTFRSAQCQSDSPVKTLDSLEVGRVGEEIHVTAVARSFLHHQVRSMVGCLSMVGRGQWKPDDMRRALEARDRSALGFNAPPHGLYFVEAIYP